MSVGIWVRIAEAAKILGVSEDEIHELTRTGGLPSKFLGGETRVSKMGVENLQRNRQARANQQPSWNRPGTRQDGKPLETQGRTEVAKQRLTGTLQRTIERGSLELDLSVLNELKPPGAKGEAEGPDGPPEKS
jgi:excisionase family DNA binding protein